ncbi:MAG: ArsR family transcriptional regulator [Promethearchaeota archaeon]|nr:MAG: ArsR family transcriptional regulator [Candidatus Lokiarchaeota archaeon]
MEINEVNESKALKVGLLKNYDDYVEIDDDKEIERIVKALSSKTRREILRKLQQTPLDVSNLAEQLDMTEANISAQIKKLQKAKLITCSYKSGKHGVRKLSLLKFNQVLINFT